LIYAAFYWRDSNERPDDDLIEVETCSLSIQQNLICLTYVVRLYVNGLRNIEFFFLYTGDDENNSM